MKKTFLKNIALLLAAGAMTMGMATTSFAGKSEDGTPGTWKQNENGYLMTNATTPDGYQTDAYGRLVVN